MKDIIIQKKYERQDQTLQATLRKAKNLEFIFWLLT